MTRIRVTGLKHTLAQLKRAERNLPIVRAQTLNDMAFAGMFQIRGVILPKNYILRNHWTRGSIQVRKAGRQLGSIAKLGSTNPYMITQELGDSSYEVGHIATDEARTARSHEKRVAPKRRLSRRNFGGSGTMTKGNREAFIRVKQALRTRDKGTFRMEISGKHGTQEGLYKLKFSDNSDPLKMIHNVSKEKVRIKPKPWLAPVTPYLLGRGRKFFEKNFNRWLRPR